MKSHTTVSKCIPKYSNFLYLFNLALQYANACMTFGLNKAIQSFFFKLK